MSLASSHSFTALLRVVRAHPQTGRVVPAQWLWSPVGDATRGGRPPGPLKNELLHRPLDQRRQSVRPIAQTDFPFGAFSGILCHRSFPWGSMACPYFHFTPSKTPILHLHPVFLFAFNPLKYTSRKNGETPDRLRLSRFPGTSTARRALFAISIRRLQSTLGYWPAVQVEIYR